VNGKPKPVTTGGDVTNADEVNFLQLERDFVARKGDEQATAGSRKGVWDRQYINDPRGGERKR
jgi:hypothetical protein